MITNAILTKLRNALAGSPALIGINYLAIGSGVSAVTGTEVKLVNETFRIPIGTVTSIGDLDLQILSSLNEAVGNLTIREVGIFANGSATKDSGTLITRILYTADKTSLQRVDFSYLIELDK